MSAKRKSRSFISWMSYSSFRAAVQYHQRFVYGDEVNDFLSAVAATAVVRMGKFRRGTTFWRAQLGHDLETVEQESESYEVPSPFRPNRMRPLRNEGAEGRANSKGIPVLYLASNAETAMAEVRPWVGSQISLGQFKTVRDLVLVDCSLEHKRGFVIYTKEPDPATRTKAVWRDIDRSFSEPMTPSASSAEYAPTQILADLFRREGYDGIVYGSNLAKGLNVALFDLEAAKLSSCCLKQANSVTFSFSTSSNGYDVSSQ